MYESVFYTVAPMVLVGVVAVPAALAMSICAGVRWFAERRELKAAEAEAEGECATEAADAQKLLQLLRLPMMLSGCCGWRCR